MRPNVSERIVEQDLCIGCGMCDAICPVNVLKMDFNDIGNYQPFESEGCLDKCTLCLDVCPFISDNEDEKQIAEKLYGSVENVQYDDNLGYFLKTYEIHKKDNEERLKSASGGAGNCFLKQLFDTNTVDYVLTVEANNNSDKLFKFSVFDNSFDLGRTRGSVYYPTEMSEVLDYVMKNDGRYAITVLPCFATAIRLAQGKNHKLRKRIKVVIGLVCGQMKSKFFTEELGKIAHRKGRLSKVEYRVKQPDKPANEYAFRFTDEAGEKSSLTWSSAPEKFWSSRMFTPNACNTCTDVFALNADFVLMDAWLPEYKPDYRGHTLVIVRTNEIDNLIVNAAGIAIKEINYNTVYESQKNVVLNKNSYVYGHKNYFLNKITTYRKKIQQLSNDNYENNKKSIENVFTKIKYAFYLYRVFRKAYQIASRLKGKQ